MAYIPMEVAAPVSGNGQAMYLVVNTGGATNSATIRVTSYSSAQIVADLLNGP